MSEWQMWEMRFWVCLLASLTVGSVDDVSMVDLLFAGGFIFFAIICIGMSRLFKPKQKAPTHDTGK